MQRLPEACPGSSEKSLTRYCHSVNGTSMRKPPLMPLKLSANAKHHTSACNGTISRCNKHQHGEQSTSADADDSRISSPSSQAAAHVPAAAFGSVDHAIDSIGIGWYQYFVLICVSLIWAGDAMEVMVLSYLGPAATCQFGVSAFQQSLLSSVVFGGMVLGAACWGTAADTFGRKKALLTSAGVVLTAGLASAAAPTYSVLLITRACVGFGLAGAPVAFTLLLEVLPAKSRSTWGTLVELAWTAGTVLEAGLAWWLFSSSGWRWLLLASTAPLALLLLVGQRLQESPRFLFADGQTAAAETVLQRMAAVNGVSSSAGYVLLSGSTTPQQQQQQQKNVVSGAREIRQLEVGADAGMSDLNFYKPDRNLVNGSSSSSSSSRRLGSQLSGTQAECESEHQSLLGSSHLESCVQQHKQQQQPRNEQQQQQQQEEEQKLAAASHSLDIESPRDNESLHPHNKLLPGPNVDTTATTSSSSSSSSINQVQKLLQEVRLATSTLSKQPYASTTAFMMFGWAATSFAYYGLVQLVAELHIAAAAAAAGGVTPAGGPTCIDGRLQVPDSDYLSVLITSAAEVPAVAWAAVSANWLGKKAAVCTSLLLTAVCLLPIIGVTAGGDAAAAAAAAAAGGGSGNVADIGMFGARLFVMSAFTLMWVFTPELFPTHVRALALGINNASARIGGLLSPFAAVALVSAGAPAAAECVFVVALLAACGAVVLVPKKHEGVGEQDMEEDVA